MESLAAKKPSLRPRGKSNASRCIRVLISDNTQIGCELLKTALGHYRNLSAVCSPNDLSKVIALADQFKPHVLLVSCEFDRAGLTFLHDLCNSLPNIPSVALVNGCSEDLVTEMFRSGVRGVLRRSESLSRLVKCLNVVFQGQIWATSADLIAVMKAFSTTTRSEIVKPNGEPLLSPREQQVAQLTAEGLTNREVGLKLEISEHTVKNYLFKIYDKLGVSTRVELILYAAAHRQHVPPPEVFPVPSPAVSHAPGLKTGSTDS
jgi:DNA-binding NarL/FixJ family response regulator